METSGDATGPASRGARHRWPRHTPIGGEGDGAVVGGRALAARALWGKRRDSPEKRAGKAVSIVESVGRLPPEQDHNTRWPRKAGAGGEEGMRWAQETDTWLEG